MATKTENTTMSLTTLRPPLSPAMFRTNVCFGWDGLKREHVTVAKQLLVTTERHNVGRLGGRGLPTCRIQVCKSPGLIRRPKSNTVVTLIGNQSVIRI